MSLPDPRSGSGYGSSGKSASGLGNQYQKYNQFPYREPDKYKDPDCEDDDQECSGEESGESQETHKSVQNKTLGTHLTADPYKRRDYGSFSGHAVSFNLYQNASIEGPLLTSEMGVTGNSISPIPNLYKGRQAGGAMGCLLYTSPSPPRPY